MRYSPWEEIVAAGYEVPEGCSATGLLPELLATFGSTDGYLRDKLTTLIACRWIDRGYYQPSELGTIADQLLANLQIGLGEEEDDSVFLRSASALVLAKMGRVDREKPFMSEELRHRIVHHAIDYLSCEADWRGHIGGTRGWAHAIAHAGDLLRALANMPQIGEDELQRILQAIGDKVKTPCRYVLLSEEDERLAKAVVAALRRQILSTGFLRDWLLGVAEHPPNSSWLVLTRSIPGAVAYRNTKSFLRSLYFQCAFLEVPGAEQLKPELIAALKHLDIYIYKYK